MSYNSLRIIRHFHLKHNQKTKNPHNSRCKGFCKIKTAVGEGFEPSRGS
jgi:hypothetical protein